MAPAWIRTGLPALFAFLGAALLTWWVRLFLSAPAPSERPLGIESIPKVPTAGSLSTSEPSFHAFVAPGTPVPLLPGAWPGFRGPDRDNISKETVALARQWPPSGPPVLWSVELGEGYAAPAVINGRVYVLDYDKAMQSDVLRCFALADGKELWRRSYPVVVKRNHGMSRTVPATDGKFVVSLGPKCHVMCVDAVTGDLKWLKDLVQEYGTTVPEWYAGQCPLIDGDKVILAPAGSALVVAIEMATGKEVWRTPNPKKWEMTHSSLLPITVGKERMYVYCGSGGVAGVSARDGRILWETDTWTINTATVPTPVDVGEGRIFLSGGYEAGAMLLQIEERNGAFAVKPLFRVAHTVFGSDQQTPIFYKGHIYGVAPDEQLVCLDLTGKRVWASGATHRFGLGPYLIAQDLIFALDDKGKLTLAEASPAGFKPLAEANVLTGGEAWGPLALAGGRLLARDMTRMVCLDVASR